MAWTAPIVWPVALQVTAALLNAHIRDNLLALDQHVHTGADGDGIEDIGVDSITWGDQGVDPASSEFHRKSNDIIMNHGSLQNMTTVDAASGTLSLRTLGFGALQLAPGDHTHSTPEFNDDFDDDSGS